MCFPKYITVCVCACVYFYSCWITEEFYIVDFIFPVTIFFPGVSELSLIFHRLVMDSFYLFTSEILLLEKDSFYNITYSWLGIDGIRNLLLICHSGKVTPGSFENLVKFGAVSWQSWNFLIHFIVTRQKGSAIVSLSKQKSDGFLNVLSVFWQGGAGGSWRKHAVWSNTCGGLPPSCYCRFSAISKMLCLPAWIQWQQREMYFSLVWVTCQNFWQLLLLLSASTETTENGSGSRITPNLIGFHCTRVQESWGNPGKGESGNKHYNIFMAWIQTNLAISTDFSFTLQTPKCHSLRFPIPLQ